MGLRYYQSEAIEAILFSWIEHNRILFVMGTGAGKTRTIAELIALLAKDRTKRFLFIGDQDELCDQPARAIRDATGVIPAMEKAQNYAPLGARIVVGSSQTLGRQKRLDRFPPDQFDYIFVDEAHRGTDSKMKICDHFPGAQVLGATATPFRKELADLSQWFEDVAYTIPLIDQTGTGIDLIEEGFAPPLFLTHLPEEIDLSSVEVKKGPDGKDYDQEQLGCVLVPHFKKIAEFLGDTAQHNKIIVALPLISSSMAFAETCRSMGLRARHIDGKTHERDLLLREFSMGRFDIICNSNVLSTGVDIPIADYFLPLKPMGSRNLYQQFVGRIMRVLPGVIDAFPRKDQADIRRMLIAESAKPCATVCDVLFMHDQLQTMHAGHLYAQSEEDARGIFEQIKKNRTPEEAAAIAKAYQRKKEEELRERLEAGVMKSTGKLIDAGHVAALVKDRRIINYEPTAKWEMQPASDRQKMKLRNFGIDPETVKSAGLASLLMSACIGRIQEGLCSLKQIRALMKFGIENCEDWTFEYASQRLDAEYQRHRHERSIRQAR